MNFYAAREYRNRVSGDACGSLTDSGGRWQWWSRLVVIFSETDCMRYATVSMDVFTNHGRWPSLQFGAIEAVLNQFAEELDKEKPWARK